MADQEGLKAQTLLFRLMLFDLLAIFTAVVLGLHSARPAKYFGEHQFITWISSLQLLSVSWLVYRTYRVRRAATGSFFRSSAMIWALISFGFLYLVADEYFLFHEGIDHWIHEFFQKEETALTDRLDDIIVGLYGVVGLCVLYVYRKEVKQFRQALPFLVFGFVLMIAMVAVDTVANRPDFTIALLGRHFAGAVLVWLTVAEDSFKLLAEACFIGGFYDALTISKRIGKLRIS